MKKISHLNPQQESIEKFEYENPDLIQEIMEKRYVKYNAFGEKVPANKDVENPIRVSETDLPLARNKTEHPDEPHKDYEDMRLVIQKALNGERIGETQTPEEGKKLQNWICRDLEDAETRLYIQEVFEQALSFLEDVLEIYIPKGIKKDIASMHKSVGRIVDFISKTYANNKNKKSNKMGAIICAICNVSDVIHYTKNKKDQLQSLEEKTELFGNYLAQNSNSNNETGEDLMNVTKKYPVYVSYEGGGFTMTDFKLDTKEQNRIWGKLLRVADKNLSDIVRDGVRCRIMVSSNEKAQAIEWLKKIGFWEKPNTNISRGATIDQAIFFMMGNIDGANVEIQVTDEESFKKTENGVYRHEIYEEIQKLLILSRLFGNIHPKKIQSKLDDLEEEYRVDRKALEDRFHSFFFLHQETGRWHSYEYEFRMHKKGIYPKERFDALLQNLNYEMNKDDILSEVSFADLEYIFEKNLFPESLNEEHQEAFLKFLKTKKGIPKGVCNVLEEPLRKKQETREILQIKNKKERDVQKKIKKIFLPKKIHLHKDVWNDVRQKISEILPKIEKEPLFWAFLEEFSEKLKHKRDTCNEAINPVISETFYMTYFWDDQRILLEAFIEDEDVKNELIAILKKLVDDSVQNNGDLVKS